MGNPSVPTATAWLGRNSWPRKLNFRMTTKMMVGSDETCEMMVRCRRWCVTARPAELFWSKKIMSASWLLCLTITIFQTFKWTKSLYFFQVGRMNSMASMACDAALGFQHLIHPFWLISSMYKYYRQLDTSKLLKRFALVSRPAGLQSLLRAVRKKGLRLSSRHPASASLEMCCARL